MAYKIVTLYAWMEAWQAILLLGCKIPEKISYPKDLYKYRACSWYIKRSLFSLKWSRVILVNLKIIYFSVEAFVIPPSFLLPRNYLVTSHMPGSFLTLQIIWHMMNSVHSQPTKIHLAQCQLVLSPKCQLQIYICLMFYVNRRRRGVS